MSLQPLNENLSTLAATMAMQNGAEDDRPDCEDAFESIYELLAEQPDCQQLVVRRKTGNEETLFGFTCIHWQADQQTAVVHLPVFPAFASVPNIETEMLDGSARVRVTDCQPFGVRVELIRGRPCSVPATMRMGFTLIGTTSQICSQA